MERVGFANLRVLIHLGKGHAGRRQGTVRIKASAFIRTDHGLQTQGCSQSDFLTSLALDPLAAALALAASAAERRRLSRDFFWASSSRVSHSSTILSLASASSFLSSSMRVWCFATT